MDPATETSKPIDLDKTQRLINQSLFRKDRTIVRRSFSHHNAALYEGGLHHL